MKIQESPNRWSCLPTAFAIAMNVRVEFIIKWIGHDGGEILRPQLQEPDRRRGFHVQELISYAWQRGHAVTPFEANPCSIVPLAEPTRILFPDGNEERMLLLLHGNVGVLTGQSLPTGLPHAVAWDGGGRVYNPSGQVQQLGDFAINTFWAFSPRGY